MKAASAIPMRRGWRRSSSVHAPNAVIGQHRSKGLLEDEVACIEKVAVCVLKNNSNISEPDHGVVAVLSDREIAKFISATLNHDPITSIVVIGDPVAPRCLG